MIHSHAEFAHPHYIAVFVLEWFHCVIAFVMWSGDQTGGHDVSRCFMRHVEFPPGRIKGFLVGPRWSHGSPCFMAALWMVIP